MPCPGAVTERAAAEADVAVERLEVVSIRTTTLPWRHSAAGNRSRKMVER